MYIIDYKHHNWTASNDFSIDRMNHGFNMVIEMLWEAIPNIMPNSKSELKKDYCVYVLGDEVIKYYGVTWRYNGVIYSAKGGEGFLKDLYIIYDEGPISSVEISWDSFTPVAVYEDGGFTKKDLHGNVLLPSIEITSEKDLPRSFIEGCDKKGFPWYVFAYGYSVKPYGETIEFSLPEWVNALYN